MADTDINQTSPETPAKPATAESILAELSAGSGGDDSAKTTTKRKKGKKAVPHAHVYIFAGFNNTLVTVTDDKGNSLVQSSAGASGFKGTKKSTPYAAQIAAENAMGKAEVYGITEVDIFVKGIGPGRDQAVRGVLSKPTVNVLSIQDVTPIAHGGCRKKKPRRV